MSKQRDTSGDLNLGGRPGRDSDRGWDNARDREDDGPVHDATRLTNQERYGVTYGNHGKQS